MPRTSFAMSSFGTASTATSWSLWITQLTRSCGTSLRTLRLLTGCRGHCRDLKRCCFITAAMGARGLPSAGLWRPLASCVHLRRVAKRTILMSLGAGLLTNYRTLIHHSLPGGGLTACCVRPQLQACICSRRQNFMQFPWRPSPAKVVSFCLFCLSSGR